MQGEPNWRGSRNAVPRFGQREYWEQLAVRDARSARTALRYRRWRLQQADAPLTRLLMQSALLSIVAAKTSPPRPAFPTGPGEVAAAPSISSSRNHSWEASRHQYEWCTVCVVMVHPIPRARVFVAETVPGLVVDAPSDDVGGMPEEDCAPLARIDSRRRVSVAELWGAGLRDEPVSRRNGSRASRRCWRADLARAPLSLKSP